MTSSEVRLTGVGLHGGEPTTLIVRPAASVDEPLSFASRDQAGKLTHACLHELVVMRADHGVQVMLAPRASAGSPQDRDGASRPRIDLVEHVLAAIGGLGLFRGVVLEVVGGEVPLLDGGAREMCAALSTLSLAPSALPGTIVHRFEADVDGAHFRIIPDDTASVAVTTSFAHPAIGEHTVSFAFDPSDFVKRLAPARTFGFLRDHAVLLARGRARGVDPRAVLVFDDEGPLPACAPTTGDEPARHKLLDLLGDMTLFGGPFRGRFEASRPGHARTHRFLEAAFRAGALRSTEGRWRTS